MRALKIINLQNIGNDIEIKIWCTFFKRMYVSRKKTLSLSSNIVLTQVRSVLFRRLQI